MAAKRRAGKQLTQDNWDQEEEPEEVGIFEKAPEDVLKNRVIRTAKRRGVAGSTNEEGGTKSLFSGFSGFSSANSNTGSKSFSFLSGNKITNSTSASNDQTPSKALFSGIKTLDNVKNSGDAPYEPFSFLSKSKLPNGTNSEKNEFSFSSKTNSNASSSNKLSFPATDELKNEPSSCISQPKLQELSKQLKKSENQSFTKSTSNTSGNDDKNPEEIFLRKLKSLNLLCAEWILEHLNEDPHCILTPVFDDYKKHLNQLKEERQANNTSSSKKAKIEIKAEAEVAPPPSTPFKAPDFKESLSKVNFGTSFFSKPQPQSEPMFGNSETKPTFDFNKSTKSESDNVLKPISNPLFSFSSNISSSDSKTDSSTESEKPKPIPSFSFTANDSSNQFKNPFFNAASISTSSEVVKPVDSNEDNDDQPPVLEDANITEEGSVFDKKCKVFIKKDGNYVDHGIGFLFLKLIGEEKKCQLIVRANNKLANIIINVLISSSLPPLQKQGKNNVMIMCYPTPDAKQPAAVLLKVKTAEDADQLLELMNKYKK